MARKLSWGRGVMGPRSLGGLAICLGSAGCGDASVGGTSHPMGTAGAAGSPGIGGAALPTGGAGGENVPGAGGDSLGTGGVEMAGAPGSGGATTNDAGAMSSTFSSCALKFPYQDEPSLGTWLGGDSAYSTMLMPTTALWSFQDTFVGKHGQTVRAGAGLIAGSFALVTCEGGVGSLHYVWGLMGGSPRAIFSDGTQDQRFWAQQPFLYKGTLFAAMTRVQGAATEVGTSLARVANPLDPPAMWKVEYFDLASISGLGKGTVVVDNYAYLYGSVGSVMMTRLPLDELVKPATMPKAVLQYLASDGTYKPGLVTSDVKHLGFDANVGISLRYLKTSSQWLALFMSTSSWPSANIAISTAPALEGPWSKPVTVYKVPEMTPGAPEYDADNICYAAIEHVESNPDPERELLFSYTCNSAVPAKQLANMSIYLPKIVKIKNPLVN